MAKRKNPDENWKLIICPVCGAEPARPCRNLAAAPHSSAFGARRGAERSAAALARAPVLAEPHAARVEKAGAMR